MSARLCANCKRLVEDEAHIICPDCGVALPEPIDDPTPPDKEPPRKWTQAEAIAFYKERITQIEAIKNEMPRINNHMQSLGRANRDNKFLIHSHNSIVKYLQALVGIAIDYHNMMRVAIAQIEASNGEQD